MEEQYGGTGYFKKLRGKNNLTQDQLAERVKVTRQAVSRWEIGETQPNTDTLLDFLVSHLPNSDNLADEDRRIQFDSYLMQLKHWK